MPSTLSGRRTLRMRSASRAASPGPAMVAPAFRYCSSEMPAADPAPASTTTLAPAAANFLTVSGVAATRGSTAGSSRRTAIRIGGSADGDGEKQEPDDRHDHQRLHAPLGEKADRHADRHHEEEQHAEPEAGAAAVGEKRQREQRV